MPKNNPSTMRSEQIVVRVNEFELKMLESFAQSQHVTTSEAVRMLIRRLEKAG